MMAMPGSSLTLPTYLIQAYRKGGTTVWTTNDRADVLEVALKKARQLTSAYGRRTRVIDQEERVYARVNPSEPTS